MEATPSDQPNISDVHAEQASTEKAFAAEKHVAAIRLAIVIFNTLLYCFLMDQSNTIPMLAYAVIVVALGYSLYVHFFRPYRRYPVMLSSYFTSVTDAALITLWLYATGGVASQFYVLWYAAITSIAFRFSFRETAVAAMIYSASYLTLLTILGELVTNTTDIAIRIGYIFFVGSIGAFFAREALHQVQTKLVFQDLSRRLARETQERKQVAEHLERSLAQLQATLEATVDGILVVDQTGKIQGFNQQYLDMWRIPQAVMVAQDSDQILAIMSDQIQDAEQFYTKIQTFYQQQETEGFDILELKDGRLIERYLKPQRVEGTRIGWVWSFHDITERTRTTQALARSQAQLAEAQQLAHIGSWDWDLITRQLTWSDEFYRIVGSQPQSFEPTYDVLLNRVHPDDRARVDQIVQNAYRDHQPFEFHFRILSPDGDTRILHGRGTTVTDDEGSPIRMLGAAQDVTELKQAEERATALIVEKERMKLLADFVKSASHDFRTPLATIFTSLYLYRIVQDAEKRTGYLNMIEQQAERLTELVDGLFTLTQLDSGQQFTFRPLHLNELVKTVTEVCQTKMDRQRVTVKLELSEMLPQIQGDVEMIGEALLRLVDNAGTYTPPDGTVTIRTYTEEAFVVAELSDTGIGIGAADLPYLFDHFYRADKARSTDTGGIGLGLSIARKIIDRHKGKIVVESEPGIGSTFYVFLPAIVELPQP